MKLKIIALMMITLIISLPFSIAVLIVPNSVSSSDVTDASAQIEWETNVLADGLVEYGKTLSQMTTIPETGGEKVNHKIDISGMDSGQKYFYRVISSDNAGPASSDYYDFTTRLSAPGGLQATPSENSIELSWSIVSGASKYKVFKNSAYVAETTDTSYTFSGLSPDTSYNFQVSVVDHQDRESDRSAEYSASTSAEAIDISFIQVSGVGTTSATVSWQTSASATCTLYYDQDTTLDNQKQSPQLITHSVLLSGLDIDSRYYYQIQCADSQSAREYFSTLDAEPDLQITNIRVSEITGHSARVAWNTNTEAGSIVRYSTDDSFDKSKSSTTRVTAHSLLLDDLDAGATYYYKVISDDIESGINNFNTIDTTTKFLQIDPIPKEASNTTLTISGTTRQNSRVYIFVNGKDIAQVREQIDGTRFTFKVQLDPGARYDGVQGKNFVEIYSWDQNGEKDYQSYYVVCDKVPPELVVDNLPVATKETKLKLTGRAEPGSVVEFFVEDKGQGQIPVAADGTFKGTLTLNRDGEHKVRIVATDPAGNQNVITETVELDRKVPSIEFLPDKGAYGKETHFKILKIKGKTEAHAKVVATNFGQYAGCTDPKVKTEFGGCDQFVHEHQQYDEVIGVVDIAGYALGMSYSTHADADGEFAIVVSLIDNHDNKVSVNNIQFNVTDRAGNVNSREKLQVKYKPGCGDWHIGKLDSYPYNIYTRELTSGDVEASVFFPIQYMGSSTPKVTQVYIKKDTSNSGYLMKNQDDLSRLFEVDNGAKVSMYDPQNDQMYVHVPLKIKKYSGPIDDLPNELNAFLEVQITYGVDDSSATCSVYPVVAFDLHKPIDVTRWLTPEMINNTIKKLDMVIVKVEKAIKMLRTASLYGLIACGAMIAYDYLKGFAGGTKKSSEGGKCTESQEGMVNTFWVCDRILCPKVPPKCDEFDAEDGFFKTDKDGKPLLNDNGQPKSMTQSEYNKQADINKQYRDEYNRQKATGKTSFTYDQWLEQNNKNFDDPYQHMSTNSYSTHQEAKWPFTQEQDMKVRYLKVSSDGKFTDPNVMAVVLSTTDGEKNKVYVDVDSRAKKTALDCKGGTVVEVQTKTKGKWEAGKFIQGESIGAFDYQCIKNAWPEELGAPEPKDVIQGCYNEDCPQFDQTKCFYRDEMAPAGGLFSSALCVCLPGLLEHLKNYLQILKGMRKCLQQVLIGDIRGGFCERLFAQFVCDLLIEAFKFLLNAIPGDESGSKSSGDTGIAGRINSYKKNSEQVSDTLSNRYGDIVDTSLGLSSDRIVHTACVVGITGDWSLLEDIFNDVVDQIEVKPQLYLLGESRPFGHDPFTGTMTINYNIYVGIVPGGETDWTLRLECDKTFQNGKFCGQNVDPIWIKKNGHLGKDDVHNQNHIYTDSNALWWYNKAVLEARYNIAGEPQVETVIAEIWPKGDLANSCHLDLINGITCDYLQELNPQGLVQLYSTSQGSHLTPPVTKYATGDSVSALLKMRNGMSEPFYLIMQPAGTDTRWQYKIEPGGGYGSHQRLEDYIIWIEDIGTASHTSSTVTGDGEWNIPISKTKNSDVKIQIGNQWKNVLADIDVTLSNDNTERLRCQVWSENAFEESGRCTGAYSKGIPVAGSTVDRCDEAQKTYTCIHGDDVFTSQHGNNDFSGKDIKTIDSIKLKNPVYAPDYSQATFTSMTLHFYGIDNFPDQLIEKGTTSTPTQGTNKVRFNVYSDSNQDGTPDTPLMFAGGTGDQTVEFTYNSGTVPNSKPIIDFVEPMGKYLNNDGQAVPIGFNVWNADKWNFKITNRDKSYDYDYYRDESNTDYGSGTTKTGRTTIYDDRAPPFVEYYVNIGGEREPTNMYDITIIATNAHGETKITRRFQFDEPEGLKQGDVKVCLGGGTCSGPWKGPDRTTAQLSNIGAGLPSVRTG